MEWRGGGGVGWRGWSRTGDESPGKTRVERAGEWTPGGSSAPLLCSATSWFAITAKLQPPPNSNQKRPFNKRSRLSCVQVVCPTALFPPLSGGPFDSDMAIKPTVQRGGRLKHVICLKQLVGCRYKMLSLPPGTSRVQDPRHNAPPSHVPRDQSIHQRCPAWPGQPGFMRIFHQHRAQHRKERSRQGPVLRKQSSSSTQSLHPP